ncbi:hypothetical protein HZS61_005439 [Fusarium oxysporum f. sp. conglutinans]|uniref:Uncharacterized protein n=1 Tax=Fusarium oxysporum f. sp. conglutinans TaxID=100902 RepID=A0A8H6GCE8_FUSOX|nr:hypothetical protein HZS61_005439 [Fusarium oxysporum f. sp. conglutinans]
MNRDASLEERLLSSSPDQVVGVAPEAPMEATYYRPYLLRDIGGYYVRAKSTRKSNPGHPEARSPGVIRAKAYNCSKELFGVMFSDYQLFSSGFSAASRLWRRDAEGPGRHGSKSPACICLAAQPLPHPGCVGR